MTFLVTDSSGAVIGPNNGEYITGEDGRIVIKNLEPGATITAKEIKVPEGVILDTAPKSIQIKTGEGQILRFVNKKAGTLVVRKLDKVSKAPLANTEFEITYAEYRLILKRRLLDGVTYDKLSEEFDMSVRQVKNIVYKAEDRLFNHR